MFMKLVDEIFMTYLFLIIYSTIRVYKKTGLNWNIMKFFEDTKGFFYKLVKN